MKVFTLHQALAADLLALIAHVGDKSNLILDPALDSYYLMDSTLIRLPALTEEIGQIRELGKGIAGRKKITQEERTTLIYKLAGIQSHFDAIHAGAKVIYQQNPPLQTRMEGPITAYSEAFKNFQSQLTESYVVPEKIDVKLDAFTNSAAKLIEETQTFYMAESIYLEEIIVKRIEASTRIKYFVISFVLIFIVLLLYVFSAFYVSIMQAIRELQSVVKAKLRRVTY